MGVRTHRGSQSTHILREYVPHRLPLTVERSRIRQSWIIGETWCSDLWLSANHERAYAVCDWAQGVAECPSVNPQDSHAGFDPEAILRDHNATRYSDVEAALEELNDDFRNCVDEPLQKDYKLAIKRGLPITELDEAIRSLAQNNELPLRYKDHPLTRN